jgi:hypothetical protein
VRFPCIIIIANEATLKCDISKTVAVSNHLIIDSCSYDCAIEESVVILFVTAHLDLVDPPKTESTWNTVTYPRG